jgi:hypothetical protein
LTELEQTVNQAMDIMEQHPIKAREDLMRLLAPGFGIKRERDYYSKERNDHEPT